MAEIAPAVMVCITIDPQTSILARVIDHYRYLRGYPVTSRAQESKVTGTRRCCPEVGAAGNRWLTHGVEARGESREAAFSLPMVRKGRRDAISNSSIARGPTECVLSVGTSAGPGASGGADHSLCANLRSCRIRSCGAVVPHTQDIRCAACARRLSPPSGGRTRSTPMTCVRWTWADT